MRTNRHFVKGVAVNFRLFSIPIVYRTIEPLLKSLYLKMLSLFLEHQIFLKEFNLLHSIVSHLMKNKTVDTPLQHLITVWYSLWLAKLEWLVILEF